MTLDSPVFKPQQFYAIGYVQDSWRATANADARARPALRLLLGGQGRRRYAKPFFIEENDFSTRSGQLLRRRTRTTSRRAWRRPTCSTTRPSCAAASGSFYGPGQFEDRIQPIENYIDRAAGRRRRRPQQRAAVSGRPPRCCATCCRFAATRTTTRRVQRAVRRQRVARAARRDQPDRRLHGSQGNDMFLRGVGNMLDPVTRVRPAPNYGQVDFKTAGCLDGLVIAGLSDRRLRPRQLRRAAVGRDASLPRRPHRRLPVPVLAQQGHDAGIERGGDGAEHVRLRRPSTAPTRRTSRTPSTARWST